MNRWLAGILCIAIAGCIVSTPREGSDRPSGTLDVGWHDAGAGVDAGTADAGEEMDAGEADAGEVDAGADAGEVDAGEVDAGADAGPVPYPRRWGNPVPLAELNTASIETIPSISSDMLRVCFSSDRKGPVGYEDIYCASRSSTEDPFNAPVNQASINSNLRDRYAIIHGDELYFSSTRDGTFDVFRATWSTIAGAYGNPMPVSELNTSSREEPVSITSDGLTMFLESDRPGSLGLTDVWVSTRGTTSSAWGTPVNIASLNSAEYDWGMRIAPDASFALFSSTRKPGPNGCCVWQTEPNPAGGWKTPVQADIRVPSTYTVWNVDMLANGDLIAEVTVSGDGADLYLIPQRGEDPPPKFQWGTPVPITELNTNSYELDPAMTADGLKICFTSNRAGGAGDTDIWCATRSSTQSPFGTPVNMAAINSNSSERNPTFSSDGQELFFGSGRSGAGDIYRAVWVPADNTYKFPESVTALNSAKADLGPSLSSDDLVMLFGSNRFGNMDLFMAVRPDRTSPFGTPTTITALNTAYAEETPCLAADGYSMVFASTRPTAQEQGSQNWRLWGAEYINGAWTTPQLLQFDGGFTNYAMARPFLLPDGSVMFHRGESAPAYSDLYIAPPK